MLYVTCNTSQCIIRTSSNNKTLLQTIIQLWFGIGQVNDSYKYPFLPAWYLKDPRMKRTLNRAIYLLEINNVFSSVSN